MGIRGEVRYDESLEQDLSVSNNKYDARRCSCRISTLSIKFEVGTVPVFRLTWRTLKNYKIKDCLPHILNPFVVSFRSGIMFDKVFWDVKL